ncbi:MAG: CARDB domain-containing protein, partial [Nanoarchaeota archaeon]
MSKKQPETRQFGYIWLLVFIVALAIAFLYAIKEPRIVGLVTFLIPEIKVQDPTLILDLTFDDPNDPWKDYSSYNHVFASQGNVKWADKSKCKWYGCADFTKNANEHLNNTAKWDTMTGIAVKFWVYHTEKPTSSSSQYYFQIGDSKKGTLKTMQDNGFGPAPSFTAENGIVSENAGGSNTPNANNWYQYFIQYNPAEGNLYVWQNDRLVLNSSENFGQLNHTIGDIVRVGIGKNDLIGYLDEFTVWSRGNFTQAEILEFYNNQLLGTPPELDLYVKAIKYTLPYDWNDNRNRLITGGTMDVIFTIGNAGTKDSGSFNYEFKLNDDTVCSGRKSMSPRSEVNLTCAWSTSKGFHKGFMKLDTSNEAAEDFEENNAQRVYIPFLDRAFIHFTLSEWKNEIEPFSKDSSNAVAFDSYSKAKSFSCSEFNSGYDGNDVDPYGKKARECAMGCFVNNYVSPSNKPMCERAMTHLKGW